MHSTVCVTVIHSDCSRCQNQCCTYMCSPLKSIPVQCSGPLAGVVSPARRHMPAVGAAPDESPAPAVPGGPGWAAAPARCAPPPARYAAPAARRSAPVASPPRLHATPPAPGDIETKSREITIMMWYFTDPCREKRFTFQLFHSEVRCLIPRGTRMQNSTVCAALLSKFRFRIYTNIHKLCM